MTDIGQWLEQHGLGRYAELFTENEVDVSVLPRLSENDLKELGLPLGARRKLQAVIEQLAQSAPEAVSASLESPTLPTGEAERRQITVMFCDLVGSVELGERMDVEDYRDLLGWFRKAIVGAVERHDGFVARHQGDGLLVYFGYPQAHENDAERAVRSGLEVVRAVEKLAPPYEAELKVRVGIATGPAVVGDVLATGASQRSELAALGPTPNLAARLQSEADPNCVLISETTRQLVSGYFALIALSARELRGLSGEATPYRVVGELAGKTRFSARAGSQLSPFVGREEEMELLHRRWSRVKKGEGQVVLLVGEAGIGKSRLLEQLRTHVMENAPETFLCQCSPNLVNSALHPIIAALEQTIDAFSGGPDQISRLESWLTRRGQVDEESMGLLADVLSIPTRGRFADLEALDAQVRRERTLGVLVDHVQRLAVRAPVLCVFEDVHWADPSTRELIGRLVESIEGEQVLLVATTRPGFGADWTDLAHAQVLSLSRLSREASVQLAQGVASAIVALPAEVVEGILSRAGGNPLFIEELTRTVVQSGEPARIDPQAIPTTLQDSLMARLDASEVGKTVAQCAAVIGRSFGKTLLSAVWEETPERLAHGLEALGQSGLLYAQGEGELTRYVFKHALVRDAAYGSLLREHRVALHAKVAKTLEARHAEARETQPELVAHHLTEAGFIEKAIDYWQRAGEQAIQRSANVEAISHFRTALEHLESRPDTSEKTRRELHLHVALGPALIAVNGYAAPEVGQTYARAYDLCQQLDDDQQLVPVLVGLWLFHLLRVE
ncbi:MAG: AAA family ATPase, partial [Candidatus Bipolaricaulota bacterium]